jgi:uncharacterized membrane protein HdeD (DUF308 family)
MTKIILLLLVISAAIGAYAQARREGRWSWLLFAKTVLALVGLGALVGFTSICLSRFIGKEHALMTTLLAVIVIVIGVVVIALWLGKKSPAGKKSSGT